MFRSLIMAMALLTAVPLAAHAEEITLLPSVRLHIGDQGYRENFRDADRWHDRNAWPRHNEWQKRDRIRYDRDWDHGPRSFERGYRAGWRDRDNRREHGHRHY